MLTVLLLLATACVDAQSLIEVSTTRTWVPSSDAAFQPNAGAAPALPDHATEVPSPLLGKHSVAHDPATDRAYCFGGDVEHRDFPGRPAQLMSAELNIYDFASNRWFNESHHGTALPPGRQDHVAWWSGSSMYIHGGIGGQEPFGDLWVYHNRTWRLASNSTPALYGHTATQVGTEVYVFGGRTGVDTGKISRAMYRVDGDALVEVTANGSLPSARAFHAAVAMETTFGSKDIFVLGGTDGFRTLATLYRFDVLKSEWSFVNPGYTGEHQTSTGQVALPVTLTPLMQHACGAAYPVIFCMGGRDRGRPLVYSYDLSYRRWIRVHMTNPDGVLPLISHRAISRMNPESRMVEAVFFGGFTGEVRGFNNVTYKTNVSTEACPAGYANLESDGRCTKCAVGAAVEPETPHLCTTCPKGSYEKGGRCHRCPLSTYNPVVGATNATACQRCPAGFFTAAVGAGAAEDCVTCPVGSYAVGVGCAKCPPGTYGIVSGASFPDVACEPCAFGTWSDAGATVCTQCAAGYSSGPFVKRRLPYRLLLRGSGHNDPGAVGVSGCPGTGAVITEATAGGVVWLTVGFADYGTNGVDDAIDPVRLDLFGLGVTVDYEGPTHPKMYYRCNDARSVSPGCPSVTQYQATGSYASLLSCGSRYITVGLRFDSYGPVNISLRFQGVVPLRVPLEIVPSNARIVDIVGVLPSYVSGEPQPLTFRALDFLERPETRSSIPFTLTASCRGGPALFSINGGGAAASHNLALTDGLLTATVDFTSDDKDCQFETVADDRLRNPQPFLVQRADHITAHLQTLNTTSFGVVHVAVAVRNSSGDVVVGDHASKVEFTLIGPDSHVLRLGSPERTGRVVNGTLFFTLQVYTTHPNMDKVSLGRFRVQRISGPGAPLAAVETEMFGLSRFNGNGTKINLVEERHPFPAVVARNKTIIVEFEIVNDRTGQHDSLNDHVLVEMSPDCPGVRISNGNSSSAVVAVANGYARAQLTLHGTDGTGCKLHFGHQPDGTNPRNNHLQGVWTRPFDVVTPVRLMHNFTTPCAAPGSCPADPTANCELEAGTELIVEVRSVDEGGATVVGDSDTVVQVVVEGMDTPPGEAAPLVLPAPEVKLLHGVAVFRYTLQPSTQAVSLRFVPGWWQRRETINGTFARNPTFLYAFDNLGAYHHFMPGFMARTYTCPINVLIKATKVATPNRVPRWIGHEDAVVMELQALNDFGQTDQAYAEPFTVTVHNCAHGVQAPSDVLWEMIPVGGSNRVTIAAGGTVGGSFAAGRATITLFPQYSTQTTFTGGLEHCAVEITSGAIRPLRFTGFQVRRIFRACTLCASGFWSVGGNGVTAGAPYHPGGCVPCLAGTFSTETGATTEASCEVCSKANGFGASNTNIEPHEGRTQCSSCGAESTTTGLTGGGPCPAGSIATAPTATSMEYGYYGSIGRRCELARCAAAGTDCRYGTYRTVCSAFGTREACQGALYGPTRTGPVAECTWDFDNSVCIGPSFVCIKCPAGTANPWNTNGGIGVCRACDAGGWSSEPGHSSVDRTRILYSLYRCSGVPTYNFQCTGTGTGNCPPGTHNNATGASSEAQCHKCPAGTYSHIRTVRRWVSNSDSCPDASTCPQELHNPCSSTCPCPAVDHSRQRGQVDCTQCPPGTYNPVEGQNNQTACLPCPAGTYCPAGTATPLLSDTDETNKNPQGNITPVAVSFTGNEDAMPCADKATSDHPGYIADGGFSQFDRKYRHAAKDRVYHEQWVQQHDHISPFSYNAIDRRGVANSGSASCNATGCGFFQELNLLHLNAMDYTARLWVYNAVDVTNSTQQGIYLRPELRHSAFSGFELELFNSTNLTVADRLYVSRTLDPSAPLSMTWTLLEATVVAPWPVAYARFNVSTRGWYLGYTLFDDASLRTSPARICQCSTGFWVNRTSLDRPCLRCPPGFACSGGAMKRCVDSWTTSAQPGCNRCRSGWQCDADGRGRSIPCAAYTMKNNDTETCSPCPLGHSCRDGQSYECSAGRYGDGGLSCIVCQPGYYSLKTGPQKQCLPCPAGTSTTAMRDGCEACRVDHYSGEAEVCKLCPSGSFAQFTGATNCTLCSASPVMTEAHEVFRNGQQAILAVPRVCTAAYDFRVEDITVTEGASLATIQKSLQGPSVVFYAGPNVGTVRFTLNVTKAFAEPEQEVHFVVEIKNNAPSARADNIIPLHPKVFTRLDISSILGNDMDVDRDPIAMADFALVLPYYNATNPHVDALRTGVFIDLPAGFIGPAVLRYRVMDARLSDPALCIAPNCLFSEYVEATIQAADAPPRAFDDSFVTEMGEVYSLNVLANDFDDDRDEISITKVTRATPGPAVSFTAVCPGCPGACIGVPDCTCVSDAARGKCWPSTDRQHVVTYTPPVDRCGLDTLTYDIAAFDGTSSATVNTKVTRCFCGGHTEGIEFVFIVDDTFTESDFAWQLTFVQGIQERSAENNVFAYTILAAGSGKVLVPRASTHTDMSLVDFTPNGTTLRMDDTLRLVPTEVGGGTGRHVVLVIMAGRDAEAADFQSGLSVLRATYARLQLVVATVRQDGLSAPYSFIREEPRRFEVVKPSFEDLATAVESQKAMDEICSLSG